jgi:hypothetical protein
MNIRRVSNTESGMWRTGESEVCWVAYWLAGAKTRLSLETFSLFPITVQNQQFEPKLSEKLVLAKVLRGKSTV